MGNTILHMSAGESEGSEVSSPLQNITITTSSHNSSQRRLYGEPLRAPAGRRGRGGGEECTLPGHRVPDVIGSCGSLRYFLLCDNLWDS